MEINIADHPLIAHKMRLLRREKTPSPLFRELLDEITMLIAFEATKATRVVPTSVKTPLVETMGVKIASPKPLIIPILRAGLGMLSGMMRLMPIAEVGFIGMVRNEETFKADIYTERLPKDLSNRQCFLLDPMLATGGSFASSIDFLIERGATDITALCILGAPEGIEYLQQRFPNFPGRLVLAACDEGLNEHKYIVPGLGDAGDRLYGFAG